MRTIHIDGNGCLRCHRIGMETLAEYTGDHWDPNEHMPPHAPGSLAADHEDLVACWKNGPENTPGCDWVGSAGRRVRRWHRGSGLPVRLDPLQRRDGR